MISSEILKKIKEIEIYTSRLLTGSLVGDSRSAIKGSGLEFDQIREYQMGDDVRFIDWRASARMDKLLVKQYIEERNRTVLLAVDVSASTFFSSGVDLKKMSMAQIASVLALVADAGKDHVGLLLFSDEIENYIPPATGRKHVRSIMQQLFTHAPSKKGTDISTALNYAANLKRRDTILFVLSDFISSDLPGIASASTGFSKNLKGIAAKYDVIAIRCLDTNEQKFPAVGFLCVQDCESDNSGIVHAKSKGLHNINVFLEARRLEQDKLFTSCGVDCVDVTNNKHFMGDLIKFFRRRMRY